MRFIRDSGVALLSQKIDIRQGVFQIVAAPPDGDGVLFLKTNDAVVWRVSASDGGNERIVSELASANLFRRNWSRRRADFIFSRKTQTNHSKSSFTISPAETSRMPPIINCPKIFTAASPPQPTAQFCCTPGKTKTPAALCLPNCRQLTDGRVRKRRSKQSGGTHRGCSP